jgi:predicted RNA-binding Zn-ribbon protein involved in translation (DUF1610 family)
MNLELRQSVRLEQRLELRQSLEQRLVMDMRITAHTQCPSCRKHIDPERDRAWSDDPYNFRMRCPHCGTQFIAQLEVEPRSDLTVTRSGTVPFPHTSWYNYLCPVQTLQAIIDIRSQRQPRRRWPGLSWLHRHRPDVLYSAVKNFGALPEALVAARNRLAAVGA